MPNGTAPVGTSLTTVSTAPMNSAVTTTPAIMKVTGQPWRFLAFGIPVLRSLIAGGRGGG